MTRKYPLTFWLGLAVLVIITGLFSVMKLKAAETESWFDFCNYQGYELDGGNIYMDASLSVEDVMSKYHETINKEFNERIKQMITAQSRVAETGVRDPYGEPPETDETTGVPKACDETNYSTYCVGERLLTDKSFGYMAYRKVLDCRRNQVFQTSQERDAWSAYQEAMILGKSNEKQAEATYQAQKALTISAELEAITREKDAAKRALDQALAAYNELRTAWPMHKKYVKIYDSLLKYRDKLVEIRHQVEDFPSKFIDATTTKCT